MHFLFILANACFPMDFLVSFLVFRLSLVSFLHPKNALLFIFVTFFPTVTFFNAVCFLNAPAPIETTEYFCFFHVMFYAFYLRTLHTLLSFSFQQLALYSEPVSFYR